MHTLLRLHNLTHPSFDACVSLLTFLLPLRKEKAFPSMHNRAANNQTIAQAEGRRGGACVRARLRIAPKSATGGPRGIVLQSRCPSTSLSSTGSYGLLSPFGYSCVHYMPLLCLLARRLLAAPAVLVVPLALALVPLVAVVLCWTPK
jgi:hypothetical protein